MSSPIVLLPSARPAGATMAPAPAKQMRKIAILTCLAFALSGCGSHEDIAETSAKEAGAKLTAEQKSDMDARMKAWDPSKETK